MESTERPMARPDRIWFKTTRVTFQVLAIAIATLSLIIGWGYFQTGSATLVLPYLDGERLLVEPSTLSMAEQKAGGIVEGKFRVVNSTRGDVTLLGAEKSCTCITLDEFPLTIPRGKARELMIKVHLGTRPGEYEQSIKFFTDYRDLGVFNVKIQGVAR